MELQPETSQSTETERRKVLIVGHNPDIYRHLTGKSVLLARSLDLLARNSVLAGVAVQDLSRAAKYGGKSFTLLPYVDSKTGRYFACEQMQQRKPYIQHITVEADRLFAASGFLARKQRNSKRKHYAKIRRYVNRAESGGELAWGLR